VIGSVNEEAGKVFLSCSVSDDLIKDKGLNAGNIIGSVAKIVGGGGGGRPTFATAGGRNPEKLDEALAAVSEIVAGFIS
jgi:alanyl-tRNA synthetase